MGIIMEGKIIPLKRSEKCQKRILWSWKSPSSVRLSIQYNISEVAKMLLQLDRDKQSKKKKKGPSRGKP